MKRVFGAIMLLCLLVNVGLTQTLGHSINGRVRDSLGASITGAAVTLKNSATGLELSALTNQEGRFFFTGFVPAQCQVAVDAAGFKTLVTGFDAKVSASSDLDLRLDAQIDDDGETSTQGMEMASVEPAVDPSEPAATKDAAAVEPNYDVVQVFYATDRRASGRKQPAAYYTEDRAPDENLTYGACQVSIPRNHEKGQLEQRWSLVRRLWKDNPEKHVVLLSVDETEHGAFLQELSSSIAQSTEKQAFVFIHGFNTSFEEAARRTAQVAYDLGFHVAPILYSWPSKTCLFSPRCYPADEESVEWTTQHLKSFLQEIAAKSGATRVHLIAHSIGNRALTNALSKIAGEQQGKAKTSFHQVILGAPDIDTSLLAQRAAALKRTCDRLTLYVSPRDWVLDLSKLVHMAARAGNGASVSGIDTIDVSNLDPGHSPLANPSILCDITRLFRSGQEPDQRCGLVKQGQSNPFCWAFNRADVVKCSDPGN